MDRPAHEPIRDLDRTDPRIIGAALGAVIALASIAPAVRFGSATDAGRSVIDYVFGSEGLTNGNRNGQAIAWATGPVAAAAAGWFFTRRAIRSVDGSGLWMGAITYVLAIAIAPAALVPTGFGISIDLDTIYTLPMILLPLWMVAGVLLAPLFFVCLVAGPLWAFGLRLLTRDLAGHQVATSQSLPLWPIAAMAVLLILGWAIGGTMFSALPQGGFDSGSRIFCRRVAL